MSVYADNILRVWSVASPATIVDGATWYPRAGAIISALADWSGVSRQTMAAVVAALSPRNPWAWNVADAAAFARAAIDGEPMPKASTFGSNKRRAWAFLTDGTSWKGSALKVRSFVANMTGDYDAVTVDVWAVRVATNGARDAVRSDSDYHEIETAYREASRRARVSPATMQATTWLVAQAAGTGSRRVGRPDKSLKRGTVAIVAFLLTGQLSLGV
jgi:hypothetical protein